MTRTRSVRIAVGLVVTTVIALALVFASRFGEDPRAVSSPVLGKRVPDRPLPLLDGTGTTNLADLRGQVLVVNFWASWCVPCRQEHEELEAAERRLDGRGVRFVGIVYQDTAPAAAAFLDRLGRNYDHLLDVRSRAAIDFGLFGVPETFYIDATGTIRAKTAGPVTERTVVEAVDRLLADDRPAPGDP